MAPKRDSMAPDRIQALTDGVYAIAMTILVLGLKVPRTEHTSTALVQGLVGLELRFTDMVISFFLLAVFWSIHHRHFNFIERVDSGLVWLNMWSLLFVILVPFSTTMYGEYHDVPAAAIIFEVNILFLGLLKYAQWAYATRDNKFVGADLSAQAIRSGKILNTVTPAVSLLAIAVATVAPDSSTWLYLSVPALVAIARRALPVSE